MTQEKAQSTGSLFAEQEIVQKLLDEQKRVDYDTREYTVELLVSKLKSDEIYIPDYQREFVWSQEKKSRFIESVMLGLPIPFLFAADIPDTGKLEIIDGVQRLSTLRDFLDGKLKLEQLDKLGFINELTFDALPRSQALRFKNRSLRMIVISERADQDVRFDIFERINTGSTILTPAEFRRGAFPGPFYDLVRECSESQDFRAVCPLSPSRVSRRDHEEMVLRFFAYSGRYLKFDHDVARFLNNYLRDKNTESDTEPRRKEFHRMIAFVKQWFPAGFTKSASSRTTPRVRFEAISVGVHLALCEQPELRPSSMEWLDFKEFKLQTTTHASNSGPRLKGRVEYVRDMLLGEA